MTIQKDSQKAEARKSVASVSSDTEKSNPELKMSVRTFKMHNKIKEATKLKKFRDNNSKMVEESLSMIQVTDACEEIFKALQNMLHQLNDIRETLGDEELANYATNNFAEQNPSKSTIRSTSTVQTGSSYQSAVKEKKKGVKKTLSKKF